MQPAIAPRRVPLAAIAGRALRALALVVALLLCRPAPAAPNAPAVSASSAILVDADSGQVLFEKNADERRPPASTTKIMTALLLLETVPLDEMITADKEVSETDGSSLYLAPGESVSAEDLLYAILLRSANDACVAVAKRVAGSQRAFAELMNRRAAEIGAVNTHFANPHGLHDPDHYSTARDLATITRYAFRYPEFARAVATRYRIIQRDPANKDIYLKNHAKFLWHYPGADGVKTGYTVPAGRCFVGSATRNGWRLISVVLNSPDMYAETRLLLDYGFANFKPIAVLPAGSRIADAEVRSGWASSVPLRSESPLSFVVARDAEPHVQVRTHVEPLTAPVERSTVAGWVEALADGVPVARVELVTERAVAALPTHNPPRPAHGWRAVGTIAVGALFWYVSARPKDPRRRRPRLAAGLRSPHAGGQGHGQRPDSAGAGSES